MAWREVKVSGHAARSFFEGCLSNPRAHAELQLEGDDVRPHTENMFGMWFVTLSITGTTPSPDTPLIDAGGDPETSVVFTGTITGTDIPVQVVFFGEVLDHFLVDTE